ncbi:MAG: radical SAM protein [Brevinematia bacterium]
MKLKYIFGPVPSRRLGMSLGVDLVPHKICIYDCVFCEVGRSPKTVIARKEYISKEKIIEELKLFFSEFNGRIDHITLTGQGETTLNSKLGEIITEIKNLFPYPVAVLTHSGNIYDSKVRKELSLADVICPSLDAVSQEIFEKVDKPHKGIRIEDIIEGLIKLREEYKGKIFLEVLLVKGINDSEEELNKIGQVCKMINPDLVQINTVDRPGAYPEALPLSSEELRRAKEIISSYFDRVQVLSRHYKDPEPYNGKKIEEIEEWIKETVKRRPLTTLDISIITGLDFINVQKIISDLVSRGIFEEVILNSSKFYKIKSS